MQPRIDGPYQHGQRWRVRLVGGPGGARTRRYRSFETRAAALAYKTAAQGEAQQGRQVSAAVEAFLADKTERGLAPSSVESIEDRLRMVLGPVWDRSLRSLADRGDELYAAARIYPPGHRRAGQPRAADTHLNALAVARDWGAWCRKQRWLRANPFAEVEGVGRKALGADKPRHTVDESRRLDAWCLAHAAEPDAVLTLAYFYLGSRASELVRRDVRDLDDGGRLLWIGRTKTAAGRRRLAIPPELAGPLLAIAAGRPGEAPLFAHPDGRRWTRHVAYGRVRRVCKLAGVPVLPPQALRRLHATLQTDAGVGALEIARQLGHSVPAAPAVTRRAYIAPESAADAQVERVLRVVQGGRR